MECLTAKSKILETFNEVDVLSSKKEIKAIKEEKINKFLDDICQFRDALNDKTNKISEINLSLSKLNKIYNLDNECLELIKGLLVKLYGAHSKFIKHYVSLNFLIKKNIANEAIHNYKIAIDDLKEYTQDLDDLYFNLPNDLEFAKRIETLSK